MTNVGSSVNCDRCTKGCRGCRWHEEMQALCEFHDTAQQGAGRSVSASKNIPFIRPPAWHALPASADIGNKLKWIRSTLTTSPFHLRTLGPVSFLPYWVMIGWSHWPQPIINHCCLQVPQAFFFYPLSLLVSQGPLPWWISLWGCSSSLRGLVMGWDHLHIQVLRQNLT